MDTYTYIHNHSQFEN